MRYYHLSVGKYDFKSGAKNRAPLNIEFEISCYESAVATIQGKITLYNLNKQFFLDSRKLIGERITLRAGFEDTLITQKLNYTKATRDFLLIGTISNILGDFSSNTPTMTFFYVVTSEDRKDALKALNTSITNAPQLNGKCKISIPPKTAIYPFLYNAIRKFSKCILRPAKALMSLRNPASQTILIFAETLEELLFHFKDKFGVAVSYNAKDNSLGLYYNENEGSLTAKLKSLTTARNLVRIQAEDLIAQPEVINVGGNIQLLTRLYPEVSLNTTIVVSGALPSASQLISSLSFSSHETISGRSLFALGAYNVIAVTHKGNYFSGSAEAWSTAITATPFLGLNPGVSKLTSLI